MSDTNNDDSFANVIAELGSKLKDEFSNEMKSSINDLSEKMDLTKKKKMVCLVFLILFNI